MSTSLAEQLKKLALPETSQRIDRNKKDSLLFEPSEAAKLDRDVFYEIGLSGLKKLAKLEPAFGSFTDSLFDLSSKGLERIVEPKDINKKLDKNISIFLKLLSPYLLLKHSHKALEWLICRYRIHTFNIDDLFGLILPYHETKIFVKILRLVNLNLPYAKHWNWLSQIKKEGVHLPKSVLVNHALSDSSFLRFLCDVTLSTIAVNKKYGCSEKLGTLITFYSTTIVSYLSKGAINDHQLTIILPSFLKAVTSDWVDFKAAGYMIAGQLVATNQVTQILIDKILELLLTEEEVLKKEKLMLLLLIFQTQKPSPNIPANSVNKLMWTVKELANLATDEIQVGPLLVKIIETCLDCIFHSGVNLIEAQVLSYTLITEVRMDLQYYKSLIWLINCSYDKVKESLNQDNSDSSILTWFTELMCATIERYKRILNGGHEEEEFKKLRQKWEPSDILALKEPVIVDLMKKCQGDKKESAWLQLRPLLLDSIENDDIFEALCKVAPFYDNLVLLLCLEKVLNKKLSEESKLSKLSKILKSNFGGNNPHIREISNLLTKNKGQCVMEVIEDYFLKHQKESENSIEFEPWFATYQELKLISRIPDNSEVWSLGLKILLAALPATFSATHALQLSTTVALLDGKKIKNHFSIIKSIITYISSNKKKEIKWYDLTSSDSEIWLKVRVLECLLKAKYEGNDPENEFNAIVDSFSKTCFFNEQEFIRLLEAVCCGVPLSSESRSSEFKISPLLQIYSLHLSWQQLKIDNETVYNSFIPEFDTMLCYLLIALSNESGAIRKAVLKVIEALVTLLKNHGSYTKSILLHELLAKSKEILVDSNQVSVALYCCLSPSESVQATIHHTSASYLAQSRKAIFRMITAKNTPLYVSLSLMNLLDTVNSSEIIEELSVLGHEALIRSKESEIPRKILKNFWLRINETTSEVLEKEHVWELAIKSIKHDKCDTLCPALSCLKSITKEVFERLSDKRKFQLVECLITTRSEAESTATASAIASVVKKLYIDCQIILPIINQMITLCTNFQKKKESTKIFQPTVLDSKEWKNGISLLELIQSKKKLLNTNALIEPLFVVLKFCLDQEEQVSYEYTKQLVLGCLLDCCKKFSTETIKINENSLNVELVVQCLRASPNPQTHHHALMLLSHLSSLIPKQVMHNVMAIFTFMGTSVARLDDEHSVKIVTQVVDAVVPALVEAISLKNEDMQTVIAEILRVFVWAVKDIPQHRRKPLLLQLLNTLKPENSLWLFLLLLFENYVTQDKFHTEGDSSKTDSVGTSTNHYLGLQLCLSISPKIVLGSVAKIINYLMNLPIDKMNKEGRIQKNQLSDKGNKSDGLFDIENHTPKQLRHFAYTVLIFVNTLLMDNNFVILVGEHINNDLKNFEEVFKETIASVMKYTPMVRKQLDKQHTKFWKAMVHQCYEILDKFVVLVPNKMLLAVIKKLMHHSMKSLRRKALDLLNSLIQSHDEDFTKYEENSLKQFLSPVVEIIQKIGDDTEQEAVLLQQTALLTLKLLAKLFSATDTPSYKKVLISICEISKSRAIEGPLLGSVMLAVAELVNCLKAHSISELPVFMPLMLKVFSNNSRSETFHETDLNSITLAILKVVDVLPNFLSPYLDKILYYVCVVSVRSADKPDLSKKLTQIRQKLAVNVDHRILIPAISRTYKKLIDKQEFEALGPLFSTLSSSFFACSDVAKIVADVTQLFIFALSFRSDCEVDFREVSMEDIDKVEQYVIGALVPFVLKLSESLFKPLYYQLFHWSSDHPDRSITFFRLSHHLAESLKGLFILFAGHFLKKAATLLDATNLSKTECDFFGNTPKAEMKAVILLEYILKTLNSVFLYDSADSSNFLNKDKFEVLLHPLVDQLENTLGGIEELEKRTSTLVTPCLAQMALATDDTLWKSLNYQVLLKTKSILPQVRIGAIETIVAIATKLGDDYLLLLPETIGSLAELLEDEDERVENAMKNAIQKLEEVLGQPIRDYFQ